MSEAFARVPALLASHALLAAVALALALVIALPLAVAAARRPRLAAAALGFASLVQTIPALALLALFFPLLLGLSALVGGGVPALGFLPALLALTLYALLPILRNAVVGLTGIDRPVLEAADAVGMTPTQRLRLVEAPLALPVAIAGLRTAAVWTIGAATLSTTVGQPSLGDLIFAGLQTQAWDLVLAGCLASAALAVIVDVAIGAIAGAVSARRPRRAWTIAALLLAGVALAAAPMLRSAPRDSVVVGAKNFSEQFILARLIGGRLERAGYSVTYREGLGSAVAWRALAGGEIDVYVDYAGTLWANKMRRTDRLPRVATIAAIRAWAKETSGVGLVGPLGFENAYAIAVRADAGIRTLPELAARSSGLAFGSDLEFLERPEWRALVGAYPLRFRETRSYAPSFMYDALSSRAVDAISAFSSDGRIAADGLVVLADPAGALPPYDALLLVAPGRAGDARFLAALRPLVGKIGVEAMRRANYEVDRPTDKRTPLQAARALESRLQ